MFEKYVDISYSNNLYKFGYSHERYKNLFNTIYYMYDKNFSPLLNFLIFTQIFIQIFK